MDVDKQIDYWRASALEDAEDALIEPLAVGRTQWLEDQGSPIIEIVRREGISIPLR